MFNEARMKLIIWYVAIIMLISGLFSVAFYQVSTRELSRIIDRIEQRNRNLELEPPPMMRGPSLEELQAAKWRLLVSLLTINGLILVVSGAAGYFLAGKTLKPIKLMVDDQNQFISNASHELRTPISTLRAEMEGSLLEAKISDKEARNLINSNLEELSKLQTLVNNLLELAKSHDLFEPKYDEKVSLREIIDLAVKAVKPLAKKKEIVIESNEEDYEVYGDKNSLRELLVILLDNAIKYSHAKTKVKIYTKEADQWIKILVKDQGMGIRKEDLAHVFERFFRSDTSRSQTEGFGLGLAIAKQIVEQHQGNIKLSSVINKGTVFIIELPYAKY